jgi:hypothetical protein
MICTLIEFFRNASHQITQSLWCFESASGIIFWCLASTLGRIAKKVVVSYLDDLSAAQSACL